MTSEIALLNRSAVALAADSASTVRYWEKDHYETYYFKGTNKIFQLSAFHPVGIMIYAAASLQGAPWNVLIKSYRDSLGEKSHDYLPAYADDLFDFITNNSHIFSAEIQEKQFKSDVDIVATQMVAAISADDNYKNAPDDAAKLVASSAILTDIASKVSTARFIGNADQSDIDSATTKFTNIIKEMLERDDYYTVFKNTVDFEELAKVAISGQYKIGYSNLSNSGLVITGFGEKDYFPRLVAYRCYGMVLGKLILSEEKRKAQTISQSNGSAFVSFAQDEMIRTFIFGTGSEALVEMENQFTKAIDDFYDVLSAHGLAIDVSNDPVKAAELEKFKEEAGSKFGSSYIDYSFKSHSRPMRRVLGSLPFDELAELAGTLVLLESLKERVTSASASVSGPIDVAVISKNDGFIWIKRKHYFDPNLNPRYFSRRGITGGPS